MNLENKRWVYYLDTQSQKNLHRVCIVIENEPGYFPTGGNDTEPWYWDEETCIQQNLKLGFDKDAAREIITSSMFPKKKIKNRK